MRHPRVWFAAAPPGGPRVNPAGYYGPALVRAPWNAKAGNAARRADWCGSFLFPRLLGAPTPRMRGTEQETGHPRPTQVRDRQSVGFLIGFLGVFRGCDTLDATKG